jgi:glycosyltransferase involved in cell wall biosynthesis
MMQTAVSRFATAVLCFSEYAKDLVISHCHARKEGTILVSPPLPETLFRDQQLSALQRASLRAAYAKSDDLLVFVLSRIEPRKGILEALEAFVLVKKRRGHTRLVFLLSGPTTESEYLDQIFQVCRRYQLFDQVRFIPPCSREEVFRLYQAVDLVLLPSLDLETLGLVTLEAMRYGTPVMAFSRGASKEILTGALQKPLLVSEVSPQSLAHSLLAFANLKGAEVLQLRKHVRERYQTFLTSHPHIVNYIDELLS